MYKQRKRVTFNDVVDVRIINACHDDCSKHCNHKEDRRGFWKEDAVHFQQRCTQLEKALYTSFKPYKMDRKYCALLYSKYSQASLDLMSYIKQLPIDFPTVVGMTMISVDNAEAKSIVKENGIEYVPTLLVEYYDGTKNKFERDLIYMWVDRIMAALHHETPQAIVPNQDVIEQHDREQRRVTPIQAEEKREGLHDPLVDMQKKKPNTSDITALAMEMQKSRESDMAQAKPPHPS
jgi:hypothetical protein